MAEAAPKRIWLVVSLAATLLAACSSGKQAAAPAASGKTSPVPAVSGAPIAEITMAEYGYSISGPMVAGGTMKIHNAGTEFHMIGVAKLKGGKTLEDVSAAFAKGGDPEAALQGVVDEVPGPMGGMYGPGKAVEVTVPDFKPGNYVFICFIPAVGDGKPHASKGMISNFSVVDGKAPVVTPDAKYAIAPGQPVKGPATLTPGRHVLELDAANGSDILEPLLVKPVPGKTLADVDAAFGQIFGDKPPTPGYLSTFPATIPFSLHDLSTTRKLYVLVDLDPGDYVLAAPDTDKPGPPVPAEMINIKVG
jgi:hypothetical protein